MTSSEHREKNSEELYFTKSEDWKSEYEYRLVLLSDDAELQFEYVPTQRALRAICLGGRFPWVYRPAIAASLTRFQVLAPGHPTKPDSIRGGDRWAVAAAERVAGFG